MSTETFENEQFLVFSVLEFLQKSLSSKAASQKESIIVAMECLSKAFKIDLSKDAETFSTEPTTLMEIFKVFIEKKKVLVKKRQEEAKVKAEGLKQQGNEKLAQKDYDGAISFYSQAIAADGTSPVYYCNRAAVLSQIGNHEKAVEDCQKALELDPSYSKAHSRLGYAYLSLEDYANASKSYKKALELDPNNANVKTSLARAEEKLKASETNTNQSAAANSSANPLGGLAGLMNNPALSGLMNNPDLQQMLSNPELINSVMSNPALMNMAQSFLGRQPPTNQ